MQVKPFKNIYLLFKIYKFDKILFYTLNFNIYKFYKILFYTLNFKIYNFDKILFYTLNFNVQIFSIIHLINFILFVYFNFCHKNKNRNL